MITQAHLRSILDYDPTTGVFSWHIRGLADWDARFAGTRAGAINRRHGYRYIKIAPKTFRASRLAWLYVTGDWPPEIDHFNRNRADDSWANLRLASASQNHANAKRPSTSSTGLKGVSARGKRFRATIKVNQRPIHLGWFDDPQEAHAAYLSAAQSHFGEFAHGG